MVTLCHCRCLAHVFGLRRLRDQTNAQDNITVKEMRNITTSIHLVGSIRDNGTVKSTYSFGQPGIIG